MLDIPGNSTNRFNDREGSSAWLFEFSIQMPFLIYHESAAYVSIQHTSAYVSMRQLSESRIQKPLLICHESACRKRARERECEGGREGGRERERARERESAQERESESERYTCTTFLLLCVCPHYFCVSTPLSRTHFILCLPM